MELAQQETDIMAPDFLDIGMDMEEGSSHGEDSKLVGRDGRRARLRQFVRSEEESNHGGQGQCGMGTKPARGSTFLISLLFRWRKQDCWLWCSDPKEG